LILGLKGFNGFGIVLAIETEAQSVTKPKLINRLALRYVNRLDLPLPVGDLKYYLRTVPEVSPDLPQGLSGYFMQLQIPQEDISAILILNQALQIFLKIAKFKRYK
jgi:uncharacterized protein (TIGR04255 family)